MLSKTILGWLCMLLLEVITMAGCSYTGSIGSLSESSHWVPVRVSNPGVGNMPEAYFDMAFINPQCGWVAGGGAIADIADILSPREELLHTNDGGTSWMIASVPGVRLDFVNEKVGWVIEGELDDTLVSRTFDGGISWTTVKVKDVEIVEIDAVSESEAWGIGNTGPGSARALLHSVDGGVTWEQIRLPYSSNSTIRVTGIYFFDKNHGWIICKELPIKTIDHKDKLIVLRTQDGGKQFQVAETPRVHASAPDFCQPSFVSQLEGWVAVGDRSLLHTTDGGKTWQLVKPTAKGLPPWGLALIDCSFPTPLEGWAVGSGDSALHTRDGGKTWELVKTGAEGIKGAWFKRVVFVDKDHGWLLGEGGISPSDVPPQHPGHQISFILKYRP